MSTELAMFIGTLIGTAISVIYANYRTARTRQEARTDARAEASMTAETVIADHAQRYTQALEDKIAGLEMRQHEAEGDYAEAQMAIARLKETTTRQAGEINALKARVGDLQARVKAITQEKLALAAELENARAQNARLSAQLEWAQARAVELEADRRALERVLERVKPTESE